VLGQPDNVGRGPLGVPTNDPVNDPGTSARISNRPNTTVGTVAPRHDGRKAIARLGGNREQDTDRFPVLKLGSRGGDVQRLQRLLNLHLEPDEQLKVDGNFGSTTREAVLEFQKEEDLTRDGVVGRNTWFSLISAGTQQASWKAKPPAPPTKVVASSSTTATRKTVDQWTLTERFEYVLRHCAPYLGPDLRAQFTALLTPMNLGIMVGSFVVWAAGHFFGVSEIADAFLLGFGLVFLGKAAIDAARLLKNVIEITCSASTEAELEDAAKDLAGAIAIIGVMTFFALLAKVGRAIGNKLKAAKAAEGSGAKPPAEQEAAPAEKSTSAKEKPEAEPEPPAPKTGFDYLAQRRQKLGLPKAGAEGDEATLAQLEMNGKTYDGINRELQDPKTPMTLERVNAQTKTHAEAEAVQNAVNDGAQGTSDTAEMWVDRDPCGSCGQSGGLRSLARNLGVKQLVVHSPSGTEVYTPTQ